MQITGSIGRENHDRPLGGAERAALGNRNLEVGEELEQERLEFLIRPIDSSISSTVESGARSTANIGRSIKNASP